jgi:hypothetical protein
MIGYTSRGLGVSDVSLRFNCRGEIAGRGWRRGICEGHPLEAARSGLDGREHDATFRREGQTAFYATSEVGARSMTLQPHRSPDRFKILTSQCQIGATTGRANA